MEQKAIFLDLDGTLLNDQREITPGNRRAIDAALEKGHKVIICTGRPLVSAIAQAEKLGLTNEGCYVIAFNGATLYDMGKRQVLYRETLPLALTYQIFEEANARDLHIQTYEDDYVLVEPRCEDAHLKAYTERIGIAPRIVGSIRELKDPPSKCLVVDTRGRKVLYSFRDRMMELFQGKMDCFLSSDALLEMVPHGLNKGSALKRMAALLEIPVANTIAVGDAENDLSMLITAGLGVCMINGATDVKTAADDITQRDNNHDGVAEVIEKYML